jgi:O-antigen/teichoic acid export membrane protein
MMNNSKTISDKQLKDLFKQTTLSSPSSGFMENLMSKVESEAQKQARNRNRISFLQMAAGIFAIVFSPCLYIYFFVPEFFSLFTLPDFNVKLNPTITLVGFAVLFLLVADTLFRQHYFSRKR